MPEILVTFKNLLSASKFSRETFDFKRWGAGGSLKVYTVVMGYTSNGDDYQSSLSISKIFAREIQFRHF